MNANNNKNENLPPKFELELFEDDDTDDFLMQYLRENPIENTTKRPINTTTTMASNTNTMPIMPKMLFPHSNVTINYNFLK